MSAYEINTRNRNVNYNPYGNMYYNPDDDNQDQNLNINQNRNQYQYQNQNQNQNQNMGSMSMMDRYAYQSKSFFQRHRRAIIFLIVILLIYLLFSSMCPHEYQYDEFGNPAYERERGFTAYRKRQVNPVITGDLIPAGTMTTYTDVRQL
jgi:hypothetical protein